jgi:hypothetical protein
MRAIILERHARENRQEETGEGKRPKQVPVRQKAHCDESPSIPIGSCPRPFLSCRLWVCYSTRASGVGGAERSPFYGVSLGKPSPRFGRWRLRSRGSDSYRHCLRTAREISSSHRSLCVHPSERCLCTLRLQPATHGRAGRRDLCDGRGDPCAAGGSRSHALPPALDGARRARRRRFAFLLGCAAPALSRTFFRVRS